MPGSKIELAGKNGKTILIYGDHNAAPAGLMALAYQTRAQTGKLALAIEREITNETKEFSEGGWDTNRG
jgi:hypothetical protein